MNAIETMQNLTYGTELEYTGITRQRAAMAIQSVLGGTLSHTGGGYDEWTVTAPDGRKWKAVSDGSLGDYANSAEVVTPILRFADLDALQEVVRALRKAGAKATSATSQHVHVGAAHFTAKQLANLARIFFKQEALILAAAGTTAQRLAHYTKPTDAGFIARLEAAKPATLDALNRAWFNGHNPRPDHYESHRYHALNLTNIWRTGTVEFRLFEGTTHAGEVKANIILCLAIAAKALLARSASAKNARTLDTASSKYDFRVVLLGLGLIGDEFKNVRKHLLKRLSGDSAWKRQTRAA
jgi:hypothetical protein